MLGGIKEKTLYGQSLNGEMLAMIIENYIEAINKNVVPTISKAWNYISKNECAKAMNNAQEIYKRIILQKVNNYFPMSEEDLKDLHKEAKQNAIILFRSQAVGTDVENLMIKLKVMISEKFSSLRDKNELDAEIKCKKFLFNAYSAIDEKLRNNQYKIFKDYELEIKKLQKSFNERGPEGSYRNEILLDFCQKKIFETADYFIKEIQAELEFVESSSKEKISLIEIDLKKTKVDLLKERNDWQRKLTLGESERVKLSEKELILREQLLSLKAEKEKRETEIRNATRTLRVEFEQQVETANSKALVSEERVKEIERLSLEKDLEFKEKTALMQHKIKYLESCLEDSRKREKDYLNESRSVKKDNSSHLKDIQSRFENQIKNLQLRLEEKTERVSELERNLEEKEKSFEIDKQNWEESEIKLKALIKEKSQEIMSCIKY